MRISWFAVVLLFGRALYPQAAQVPRLSDLRFGVGVQITGVYTQGTLADINNDGKLEPVDDRFDIGLRRGRFSVAGALGTNMDFRVVFYFDNIGRDRYTGTRGTPGEGNAGIWDAFWNWHASPR